MIKIKYFMVFTTIVILLILILYNNKMYSNEVQPLDQNNEIYTLIFDAIINKDEGLNFGMKYISIDSNSINNLTEKEKKELLNYFKKYNVDVINYSLDELKDLVMFNEETLSIEGILLEIKQFEVIRNNKVITEVVKYHSGLGAIGMEYTLEYENNKWVIKQEKMLWIS